MSSTPPKPFLINKDADGQVRLTVRETRFNSQGYPWVTDKLVEQSFKTPTAARAYATEEYGALPGQFVTK